LDVSLDVSGGIPHDRQPRLWFVIASNGIVRVAGGASSVLVGVYIADLANRGWDIGAGLVGTLAAISFGAELLGVFRSACFRMPCRRAR
jgi:hypothetical protein